MSRSIDRRWQRAQQYLAQGQLAPAKAQLDALSVQAPDDVSTHVLATQTAWREDRIRAATRHALEAFRVVPDDATWLCETIEALLLVGEVVAARACLARPALERSQEPAWLLRRADYRQRLNEHAAALALIERAMAAGAAGQDVRFHHGVQLYFHGRLDEADAELEACLQLAPGNGRAALTLSHLAPQTGTHNHLNRLAAGLQQTPQGSVDRAALEFARYKELEDLGDYPAAWEALQRGNAIMRARNPFEAARYRVHLDHLVQACTTGKLDFGNAAEPGPQPIFIVGLARSGTTVLERMLGNHSEVATVGELVDFGAQLQWAADTCNTWEDGYLARLLRSDFAEIGRRYLAQTRWRARNKRFYIDKQPPNWEQAAWIHAALPQAKILHLVRDPMDVCFSNLRAFFGDTYGYSYDMTVMGAYHRAYRNALASWHRALPGAILDVAYADLVSDPEATMRQVFAFCGLEWEAGSTDVRRNPSPVATLSAAQVRVSVHNKSAGVWRHYADQLAPLRAAVEAQ